MKPLVLEIPTIAITGSCGKTTTKEMIAAVLSTKFQVFKSKRNKNQVKDTLRHRHLALA
jgi:UDP-N-acetylmuramoyl-tripeptide--D-alanyl-D-alanine ligase